MPMLLERESAEKKIERERVCVSGNEDA